MIATTKSGPLTNTTLLNKFTKVYLERVFEVFEGDHLYPEELHAHEEGDDRLGHVRRGLSTPELSQFREKLLLRRKESGTRTKTF